MSTSNSRSSGICFILLLSSSLRTCNGFQAPIPSRFKLVRSQVKSPDLYATTSGGNHDSDFLDILKDYDEDFERDPSLYYQVDNDNLFGNILNRSTGGNAEKAAAHEHRQADAGGFSSRDDAGISLKSDEVAAADNFLKANYDSFKNVEGLTNQVLQNNPLLAVGIFIGAGLFVAYLTGFLILDGNIESWNPAENGSIPYWEEGDIHVIQRIKPN